MFSGVICNSSLAICSATSGLDSQIWLYSLSEASDSVCFSPSNPHISRTETSVEVFRGSAILLNPGPVQLERGSEDQEDAVKRFALTNADATLQTGLWGFARVRGNLYGGQVTAIDRDTPGAITISLDTKKVVPFRPTDVADVGDWTREAQN